MWGWLTYTHLWGKYPPVCLACWGWEAASDGGVHGVRERGWESACDVKREGGRMKLAQGLSSGRSSGRVPLPAFLSSRPRLTALWDRRCRLFIPPEQSLAAGPQGPRMERLCHVCTHRGRDPGPASRADSLPGVRAHEDLTLVSRLCGLCVEILDDFST